MASILNVDVIKDRNNGNDVKIPGHVVAVHQFTAAETSIGSDTNIIRRKKTARQYQTMLYLFSQEV